MTRPAQTLQITVDISAAMCFRDDVVNGFRLAHHTVTLIYLILFFVTVEDASTDNIPFRTITALVSGLAWLVLLPAFAFVAFAVA